MTFEEIMADNGYRVKTTFWNDFSIADRFGVSAVKDTFQRAFAEWKHDVEYVTELVLVLNHKIWQHYEKNEKLAKVYDELWKQAAQWCEENLTGDDYEYYFMMTD